MKHTPLLFAAMAPMVATATAAADEQAYQRLQDATPVTEILGAEVTRDGEDVGEVSDIIFGPEGEIRSVLVDRFVQARRNIVEEEIDSSSKEVRGEGREFEGIWGEQDTNRMRRLAVTEWAREDQNMMPRMGTRDDMNLEQTAGYLKSDPSGANPNFGWTEEGEFVGSLTEVRWDKVDFRQKENTVVLDSANAAFEESTYSENTDFTERGEVRASDVIGTEVNLLDDDSFGEVEDVLIDPQSGHASAYVVETMDFFDREVYALPADFDATSVFQDEVNYTFTREEVERLDEFSLEETKG